MTGQTPLMSLVETAAHTVIGCALGFSVILAVINLVKDQYAEAAWTAITMVPVSAARQYIIRRWFNGIGK